MRTLFMVFALAATSAAAELPSHYRGLPAGVVEQGRAPAELAVAGEGARAPLWLPGGERTFEVQRVVRSGVHTTRFGRVRGVGQAAITLGPAGGFGRVTQGATVWLLEYRGTAAFAVRAGEGGLAFADYDDGALTAAAAAQAAPAVPAKVSLRTVDFAALYDADFAARYPGALAETRIEHFVALANQAFVDSNVAVTLRTVATRAATGVEDRSALVNLQELYDAQRSGRSFAGVDVFALRTQNGVDLMTFFRVQDIYARGVCGVAYFPADYRAGINIVMDGASGGSICDDYTFAHEVGHNLGARHQLGADSTEARGHAFVRPGQFATIMRAFGTGKPDRLRQLGYFSNPRIACGNLPCGTEGSEDNAGAMNRKADLVADYQRKRIEGSAVRPQPLLADSDGDGEIDRTDAFPFDATRTADRDGDGRADQDDAFPDNSTEWLDTDTGGLGDNADGDDDNDDVADAADRFPLDPLESADADNDGHGDAGDALDADPREQRDTDGDGVGDRADADDDDDGTDDVGLMLSAADGELVVADGATDRLLRFDGATFAALGTLLQLEPAAVTFRSGIGAAVGGEVYFVAASQLRVLDRLRGTPPELMLDPASHPQVGTGFPMSPIVLTTGDVMLGEMGVGALLTLRPAPSRAPVPLLRRLTGFFDAPHIDRTEGTRVYTLDGTNGGMRLYQPASDPLAFNPTLVTSFQLIANSSGDFAWDEDVLYWVERRSGAIRTFDVASRTLGTLVANADAAALTVSHDSLLFVARRSGGVRLYQLPSGADLGLVVSAAQVAEPLELEVVPRILDDDLPPIVPPTPPAPTPDPSATPAVGGALPPPPPCTTDCASNDFPGGGSGGAVDPRLALLLAVLAALRLLLARRRRAVN